MHFYVKPFVVSGQLKKGGLKDGHYLVQWIPALLAYHLQNRHLQRPLLPLHGHLHQPPKVQVHELDANSIP